MLLVFLFYILILNIQAQFTNQYAAKLASLNSYLPNLVYTLDGAPLQLNNGSLKVPTGSFRYASLQPEFINKDLNNDGDPDAVVVLLVVYDGIGYFSRVVFAVLSDLPHGPKVTNGIHIGMATYSLDIFTVYSGKIIVGYLSRLPGQPKAALPVIPTIMKLQVLNQRLSVNNTAEITTQCYRNLL